MSASESVMDQAKAWADSGRQLVLATVCETWGSSPCPAGSLMVISDAVEFAGSVSGGCIETSVISESLEVLKEGMFTVVDYGVSDTESAAVGLACGGTIKVLLEPLNGLLLKAMLGPRPAVRVVDLDSGQWCCVHNGMVEGELDPGAEALQTADEVRREERAQTLDLDGRRIFLQPLLPAYRLFVIGAVRIAQVLSPMAVASGFDVTIVDPRKVFATADRFPGVSLVQDWPNTVLDRLQLNSHSAVVTLTHDAKPDDMALFKALASPAFYIGALGSRKTHEKRLERLRELGCGKDALARIHAPIGLDIGARTPAEIAVSILAEVVSSKNSRRIS